MCNKCCCVTIVAVSVTSPGSVYLALGMKHALRMGHISICSLYGCTIFFDVILQTARFSEKEKVTEHKMCVLIFSKDFSETFLVLRGIQR